METKKKIIHRIVLGCMAALVAMAAVGCAEEVASSFSDRSKVEIAPVLVPMEGVTTRAADGLNDNTNSAGFSCLYAASATTTTSPNSLAKVMIDDNASNYTPYRYQVTGATALTVVDEAPTFPVGENSVNVYGWYPYTAANSFSIQTNQSTTTGYCLSDLMLADKVVCTRDASSVTPAPLAFRHVMSKVKIVLTPGTGVTVTAVALKNVKPTVAIDASTVTALTVGSASGDAGDVTLLSGGSLTSSSTAAERTLCGVFPAQTISSSFITVTAEIGGTPSTITYSFDAGSKTFVSAKEYTVNISVSATQTGSPTVSLADWTGAEGTVNIGTGGGGDAPTLSPTSLTLTFGDAASSITASAVGTAWLALSENTSVATVSGTGPISVTPVAVGSTTVHVWPTAGVSGGFSTASCPVTVNALELQQTSSGTNGYVTIASIDDQSYTGSAITPKPAVTVKVNGGTNTLVENTDFTYSYSNNTAAGTNTASVSIIPKAGANYVNSVGDAISATFSIVTCTGSALSSATVGQIICSHGKAHAATTGALSCGGDKVAIVAYKGSAGTADKSSASGSYVGLAIAMADVSGSHQWYTANEGTCITNGQSSTVGTAIGTTGDFGKGIDNTNRLATAACGSGHVHAAAQAAVNYESTVAHPTGTSQWFLPTMYQWNLMVKAMCGQSTDLTTSTNDNYKAAKFNTKITAAGGTGVQASRYWSSVEYNTGNAWDMTFSDGSAYYNYKSNTYYVRPVLAF